VWVIIGLVVLSLLILDGSRRVIEEHKAELLVAQRSGGGSPGRVKGEFELTPRITDVRFSPCGHGGWPKTEGGSGKCIAVYINAPHNMPVLVEVVKLQILGGPTLEGMTDHIAREHKTTHGIQGYEYFEVPSPTSIRKGKHTVTAVLYAKGEPWPSPEYETTFPDLRKLGETVNG
jgi:hypothetical protein